MPQSASRLLVVATYSLLALSALLVFWQVRGFDFVNYDDPVYVTENLSIQNGITPESVRWAFTTGHAGNWNPLTWLSYMLDRQLFGQSAEGYHLTNLVIHIASTLLVFLVLRMMTGALWQSAFVAALFAVHPLHVEAVAWVSGRKDVLSTLFWLLTMVAYVWYTRKPGLIRYLPVLLAFVMGIMAKPMLITMPLVLLLLDYWPLERIGHFERHRLYRLVLEKVPFIVLAVVFSLVAFFTQQGIGALEVSAKLGLGFRICNALISYVTYIEKMFWPSGLAVFYPHPLEDVSVAYAAVSAAILLAVTVLVIRYAGKHRYLATGWFWYLGTLIPVIGIIQVGRHAMADRYTYITLMGLFIMIAWGIPELLSRWQLPRFALGTAAAIALTAMGVCAYRQAGYWNDSIALSSHAIAVTRNNYVMYSSRGCFCDKLGYIDEAIADYKQAISIRPDLVEAYVNLGNAYNRLGRMAEAMDAYRQVIRIMPDSAEAYTNLGGICSRLGRRQEAMDAYQQAIKVRPDCVPARYNLAIELIVLGRCDEAAEQLRQTLPYARDWPYCMSTLAMLIATNADVTNRDANEAVKLAEQASSISGRDPAILDALAAAYAFAGRFREAVETAEKASNLADVTGQQQLRDAIRYRLSYYRQGRPYVEHHLGPASDAVKP
jgi:protein O-mannosyl-transferase